MDDLTRWLSCCGLIFLLLKKGVEGKQVSRPHTARAPSLLAALNVPSAGGC